MTNDASRAMVLLFSITDRGQASKVIMELSEYRIHTHFQAVGVGTATSDMMDLLGLGSIEKDILFSFATRKTADEFMAKVNQTVVHLGRGRGLILVIPISAISRLSRTIIMKRAGEEVMNLEPMYPGAVTKKEEETPYSLILILANHGFSDEIMLTARQAGATGGTLMRSRLVSAEEMEVQVGLEMSADREFLSILCPKDKRNAIMEAVNEKHGLLSPAQGMICALPVEKAFKL